MAELKKLFVVSDIHGHATLLKQTLADAGFDPQNADHLLISCGDVFDRGHENYDVLKFFERAKHKVMIRGNHEDMLEEVLTLGRLRHHDIFNGTSQTIVDLFGKYAIQNDLGELDFSGQNGQFNRVMSFLGEMKPYFETEHYVFTHGWLPTVKNGPTCIIAPKWRDATPSDWHSARWTRWHDVFRSCDRLSDKTIVCGHSSAHYAHLFDDSRTPDDFSPFYTDGLIVLDACTIFSKKLYVAVLEDLVELPD